MRRLNHFEYNSMPFILMKDLFVTIVLIRCIVHQQKNDPQKALDLQTEHA